MNIRFISSLLFLFFLVGNFRPEVSLRSCCSLLRFGLEIFITWKRFDIKREKFQPKTKESHGLFTSTVPWRVLCLSRVAVFSGRLRIVPIILGCSLCLKTGHVSHPFGLPFVLKAWSWSINETPVSACNTHIGITNFGMSVHISWDEQERNLSPAQSKGGT
jgi:hypothetical protein